MTSKLQVTIPKALAERYGIAPGQEIEWLPAGEAIRVVPQASLQRTPDRARRVELFDRATARQLERQAGKTPVVGAEREWRREDVYGRDGAR